MKKIVIAAGSGFLGQNLIRFYKGKVENIVILTRGKSEVKDGVKYVHWDSKYRTGWEIELENADVLINLAGKSVDCRYTETNKKEILNSRINSTAVLNLAVTMCENPPKHYINSSTATIYRFSLDKQMDEISGEIGDDFSMIIAKAWEASFFETQTPHTFKTAIRTAIVLGRKGGAFSPLKNLALLGMGGKQGNGNQFVSWIHELDFVRAIDFIVNKKMTGVVNIVAPKPISNTEFMKTLCSVLKISVRIPMSTAILKFGAKIIGTETELVLKSRNVVPKRLQENGFNFEFSTLDKAFQDLIK